MPGASGAGSGGGEGPVDGIDVDLGKPDSPADERLFKRISRALKSPLVKGAMAALGAASLISLAVGGPVLLSVLAIPTIYYGAGKLEHMSGFSASIGRRRQAHRARRKQERRRHMDRETAAQHAMEKQAREKLNPQPELTPKPEPPTRPVAPAAPSAPVAVTPPAPAPGPAVPRPGQDPATVAGTPEAAHAAELATVLRRVADAGTPPSAELRAELRAAILKHFNPGSPSPQVRDLGSALLQAGGAATPEAARAVARDALGAYGLLAATPRGTRQPAGAGHEVA
jgi:hypothetical protein